MTVTASVHTDPDTSFQARTTLLDYGTVRIRPVPAVPLAGVVIHAQAPELRRLAAACLTLADELDPPTTHTAEQPPDEYSPAYNAAILRGYGHSNDHESPRMGEQYR